MDPIYGRQHLWIQSMGSRKQFLMKGPGLGMDLKAIPPTPHFQYTILGTFDLICCDMYYR